ncbi:hypothetical protein [Tissierella pigra]|uniref:HAMP domain-containing protein n=1 Tax=Tissierella pigra TaxID=2607614 RepID=A0A6N7Y1M7_9FIRM|nr:hypothetical protein [Tissierella pigra]MSU01910.1 hypothetical protein [Tissierella pigra]
MIKELNIGIRKSSSTGIFHDSREDVRRLGKALNIAIDKINELVEIVNEQETEIRELKKKQSSC